MKKSLLTIICAAMVLSCNQSTNNAESQSDTDHFTAVDTSLTLNNGAKWKADSITNHNLIRLKLIADMFRVEPFPSQANYQILGNDLANNVDTMLQQCTMKGVDHEALHQWLTPILSQVSRLKNITDTAEGRRIFDDVDQRIDIYKQYFE